MTGHHHLKGVVKVLQSPDVHDLEHDAEPSCGDLEPRKRRGRSPTHLPEYRDAGQSRDNLLQDFESLAFALGARLDRKASNVASGTGQTRDVAGFDWIEGMYHDDGDRCGSPFGCGDLRVDGGDD